MVLLGLFWLRPEGLYICLIVISLLHSVLAEQTTVNVGSAVITGRQLGSDAEFLGVKYANAARWGSPLLIKPTGQISAVDFGNCCSQVDAGLALQGPLSEDCLNLNVYAPATESSSSSSRSSSSPQSLLPVMVWIYGGGGTTGCSSQGIPTLYNGTNLRRSLVASSNNVQDVVVVSINYRLSVLATLWLDGFEKENGGTGSGNFFMQDIRAALRWVHTYIEAFGGDPSNVLVFGESAGGNMAWSAGAAVGMNGLMNHIIAESSTEGLNAGWTNKSAALVKADLIVGTNNCNTSTNPVSVLECMRKVPVDELLSSVGMNQLGSLVGDDIFPQYPYYAYVEGNVVPGLTVYGGWNDPDNFPLCAEVPTANEDLAKQYLSSQVPIWVGDGWDPSLLETIYTMYGVNGCSPNSSIPCCRVAELIMTDVVFRCNNAALVDALSSSRGTGYIFELSCCPECPLTGPGFECVCVHTAEIPYVFATVSSYQSNTTDLGCTWNSDAYDFSSFLVNQWTSLAWEGAPDTSSSQQWRPFNENDPNFFGVTQSPFSISPSSWSHDQLAKCALWRGLDAAGAKMKGWEIKPNPPNPSTSSSSSSSPSSSSSSSSSSSRSSQSWTSLSWWSGSREDDDDSSGDGGVSWWWLLVVGLVCFLAGILATGLCAVVWTRATKPPQPQYRRHTDDL